MDAKTGAKNKSAKLAVGDQDWSYPIYDGTIGPSVVDISKLYADTGMFTYDPGFTSTAAASPRSPISMVTKASCFIAGIRSSSWRSTATSWKPATCCSTANCPRPAKSRTSMIA